MALDALAAVDGDDEHPRLAGASARPASSRESSTRSARRRRARARPPPGRAVRRAEQRFELGQLLLREEREDAAAVVVDDDEASARAIGAEQAVGVVQEAQVAAQTDDRTVGGAVAMPQRVETKPSMPLAPRFASTRRSSRGAMHHSSARTGRLDATTSVAPSGSAAARSRAMTPSNGASARRARRRSQRARRRSARSQPSSHALVAVRRSERARRSRVEQRFGLGRDALGSRRGVGSSHASSGSTTICAHIGAPSHAFATLLVSGAPIRSTTSGRCAAANAGDAEQRLVGRDRVRPAPQPEIGSASTGQPAARAKRVDRRGRRVRAPARDQHAVRVRAHASARAARRSPRRAGAARRQRLRPRCAVRPAGRVDERRAGRHQRLAERQVEVHRSGRRSDRVRDRAARERAPRRARVRRRRLGRARDRRTSAPRRRTASSGRSSAPRRCRAARAGGRRCTRSAARARGRPRSPPGGSSRPRSPTCSTRSRAGRSPGRSRAPGTRPSARRARRGRGSGRRARGRARAASTGSRARRPRRYSPTAPTRRRGARRERGTSRLARRRHRVRQNGARADRVRARLHADRVGVEATCSTACRAPSTRSSSASCRSRRPSRRRRTRSASVAGAGVYVGYSMGGRLCLRLALDRPDLVRGARARERVARDCAPTTNAPARVAADEALADDIERDGVDAFLDRWLAQPLFASIPPGRSGVDDRRQLAPEYLAACLRVLGTGAMEPLWDRLPELAMPVLLVTGTRRREVRRDRDARCAKRSARTPSTSASTAATRCRSSSRPTARPRGRSSQRAPRLGQHQPDREQHGEHELEAHRADQRGDERRRVVAVPHELDRADRERRREQRDAAPAARAARTRRRRRARRRCTRRTAAGARDAPDAHRERPLARDASVSTSRTLLASRIAHAGSPTASAPNHAVAGHRLVLHVRAADGRDEPEEHEHHHLAEADVAVRLRARRCRSRPRRSRAAPTSSSHGFTTSESTAPTTAATPNDDERGVAHRGG